MKFILILLLFLSQITFAHELEDIIALKLEVQTALYKSNLEAQMFVKNKIENILTKSVTDEAYNPETEIEILLSQVISSECCRKDPGLKPKLKEFFMGTVEEVRAMARKEGVGIAIWLGVGEVIELMSPVVVTALGHPELIVPVEFVLAPEVNVPAMLAIKRLIKRGKTIGYYGGKENFKKIRKIKKELKKIYSVSEKSVIYFENDHYFSVSKKAGLMQKLLARLGSRKKINPSSLKRVLVHEGLWNEELEMIKRSTLSDFQKSILIMNAQMQNKELDAHEIFAQAFKALHHDEINIEMNSELVTWAQKFLDVKTKSDLVTFINEIPKTAKAIEVLTIWKEVFYPRLMDESEGMGYQTYRSWSKNLSEIVAHAEINPIQTWDENWQKEFTTYLTP